MECSMTQNWLTTSLSKGSFHECLFLLTSLNKSSTYCLTFKVWNEPCPPRCPYYKVGSPANLEELEAKKYHLSCRKFTQKQIKRNKAVPFCKLYFMREPNCQQCDFVHKYTF